MVYWRLSAQVYLELSDFERLGTAVLNRTYHPEFRRLDAAVDPRVGVGMGALAANPLDRQRDSEATYDDSGTSVLTKRYNGNNYYDYPPSHHQIHLGFVDERVMHARDFNL